MARIAFLLLCHTDPDGVIAKAEALTAAGDFVAIHWDGRASGDDLRRMREALSGNANVVFTKRRVRCGWGEWSLVAATLALLRVAVARFPRASHVYLVSGDCWPIKSAEHAHEWLDARSVDHIESVDYFTGGWIKTGMQEERLVYRHFVNERRHKRLFYAMLGVQRALGLKRAPPKGLSVMIGSQWWCLRRQTVETLLKFVRRRPDVVWFFRTTWIPDETFFQTLVRHLVPEREISGKPPTFLLFSDYGMPVAFYNDHHDLLLRQSCLFARKISSQASDLKDKLGALWGQRGVSFDIADEGRALHAFLTRMGREGRRFAPRFWEAAATPGPGRRLLVIVSQARDRARALAQAYGVATGVPAYGYLFDDADETLPDLGGIETGLAKRHVHRTALLRMLFDRHGTDRLLICLDARSLDLIAEICTDSAGAHILELRAAATPDLLRDQVQRLGLGNATTPLGPLAHSLTSDLRHHSEQLDVIVPRALWRLAEGGSQADAAQVLAEFLSLPQDRADSIARAAGFADAPQDNGSAGHGL